jgi:hypothetical protein
VIKIAPPLVPAAAPPVNVKLAIVTASLALT